MTKKDYKLISKVFSEQLSSNAAKRVAIQELNLICMLHDLANALQKDNPRFNKEKFVAACYGEK